MPVRVIVTAGTTADCAKAEELIEGLEAEAIIADKGYDTDAMIEAVPDNIEVVIPPKSNRKIQRDYDKY